MGANIGVFSILASSLGAKNVIAVEPVSSTYERLTKNVQRSGFTNIKMLKNIVTNKSGGMAKISITAQNGHNSLYGLSEQFEFVETCSINELILQSGAKDIFLKVDCEGAEYDILLGASPNVMSNVTDVVLEIHSDAHPLYKGTDILERKLESFGFRMVNKLQVHGWEVDVHGQMIEGTMYPIPCCIEIWKK